MKLLSKKELNRRIKVIQQAKYYLKTDGKVMWAGEYICTEQDLYKKAIEVIGKKYAKKQFKLKERFQKGVK